jgi:hypothetical protein
VYAADAKQMMTRAEYRKAKSAACSRGSFSFKPAGKKATMTATKI